MRQDLIKASGLTITATADAARRLAERMALPAAWAARLAGLHRPELAPASFGVWVSARQRRPIERLDQLAQRFRPEPLELPQAELTVTPFAPPLRQISAARQGAAEWQARRAPAREPRLPPWARPTPEPAAPALLGDLASLGWGRPLEE